MSKVKQQFFKWQEGQQGTGYYVMTLVRTRRPFPFDCYIIKYPVGSHIPPHKDVLARSDHYRVNVILTHPKGGEFQCEPPAMYSSKWLNYFRPDLSTHSVTKVEGGTRYVFSIGWARKRNKQ